MERRRETAMDESLPAELDQRIGYYEHPENDPGPLTAGDWQMLVATGILLPVVCLILGWLLGWPA
jgi:hypothetical protein